MNSQIAYTIFKISSLKGIGPFQLNSILKDLRKSGNSIGDVLQGNNGLDKIKPIGLKL